MNRARLLLALAVLLPLPSVAQEIIVTRKEAARAGYPQPAARPAVLLRRRADNVVQGLLVTDDTRVAETRLEELRQALAALDEAAKRSPDVRVALVVETADGVKLVRPFDRKRATDAIENGSRPDSAQVHILVKTAIVEADHDLSAPVARIDAFLRGVKLGGRAQIEPAEEPALSLVKPEQYRSAVIAAIAADLRSVVDQMGAGYGGKLEGLEHPIEWAQLDELELGLYLPYRLTVTR